MKKRAIRIRTLLIVIAVIGIIAGAFHLARRASRLQRRASYEASLELHSQLLLERFRASIGQISAKRAAAQAMLPTAKSDREQEVFRAQIEIWDAFLARYRDDVQRERSELDRHSRARRQYERAASQPWLSLPPQ
jgi:hypothetical protein